MTREQIEEVDILPDCMMPDGAEPCRGYTAAIAAARQPRPITDAMVEAAAEALVTFKESEIAVPFPMDTGCSFARMRAAIEAAEKARHNGPGEAPQPKGENRLTP